MKTRCLGNLRKLEKGIKVLQPFQLQLPHTDMHTQKKCRQGDFSETWLNLSVLQIFDNSHST